MVKLFRSVRGLVKQELNLANRQNGHYFHSPHEGYCVILEEEYEGCDEGNAVSKSCEGLFDSIRKDDRAGRMEHAKEVERHATLAACEFIQVAAMARKLLDSERVRYFEQHD